MVRAGGDDHAAFRADHDGLNFPGPAGADRLDDAALGQEIAANPVEQCGVSDGPGTPISANSSM